MTQEATMIQDPPVTKPTHQDAQLIVQLAQLLITSGANRGTGVICEEDFPQHFREFEARYPLGTDQRSQVHALCGLLETVGTFWKHGLLDEELLLDWIPPHLLWERLEGVLVSMREAEEEPALWENFEALAEAGKKRSLARG